MKNEKDLKHSLDRALAPLRFRCSDEVILKTRWQGAPGRRMKRLLPVMAAALLMAAALGAIALGLYSPNYSATKAAKQAIKEKYGLSERVLDLFSNWERRQEADGSWLIRFEPHIGNTKAIGIYMVHIDKQGKAEASWTHDDKDPALYWDGPSSDDLNEDSVWGAKHLEVFFDQRTAMWPPADEEEWKKQLAETRVPFPVSTPTVPPALTAEEQGMIKQAAQAMEDQLGIGEAELAVFVPSITQYEPLVVLYQLRQWEHDMLWANSLAGTDFADHIAGHFGSYRVDLSGENPKITWSLEGKETRGFTASDWGKAMAYGPDILPWAADLIQRQRDIALKYPPAANMDEMSMEDLALRDGLFRAAGFPAERYSHALPGEGEMGYEQALQAAKSAVSQELEIDESILDESLVTADYRLYNHVIQEMEDIWTFSFHRLEGIRTIVMRATDGLIYYLQFDPNESGNG